MQQQKRPNTAVAKENKEMKIPVRKQNKVKQIKSKIFKNISQLPIDIHLDSKENHIHNHPNRPHSSLIQESHYLKNCRIESALSQYPENKEGNNRKRLSLDSTGKKYERDSLLSKNSLNKKMSRNNKSIEDSLKLKYAWERRKSNVSCRSIHEQGRLTKKQSLKIKRPSVSSLHQGFLKQKDKENKQPKQSYKLADKSRSKSKKVKRKSTVQLDKSKASTTVIINLEKANIKKKQSTSTAYIGATMLPKKKKKVNKKKSEKVIDFSNAIEEPSMEEYPISKYDVWTKPQKPSEPKRLSSKRKSRSGKESASKQRKKGSSSMFQIDYVSCINIPSNSSGLIESKQSNNSSQRNSKIKILDNWQFHYLGEQNTQSVNLEQIRYYQSYHYSHIKQEDDFIKKNFKDKSKYYYRRFIEDEIAEEYPHFEEFELKFLASVIFIQRKWRENRLYRQIFDQIAHSPNKISQMSIQKSNSVQLNISHNYRSNQKQIVSDSHKKDNSSMERREQLQSFTEIEASKLIENPSQLINRIYLEDQVSQKEDQRESIRNEKRQQLSEMNQEMNSEQNNLTTRSEKYDFLGNQLFPSISYLRVKQQQLKEELYQKLFQFNELQRSGTIDGKQYQKLRYLCEEKYKKELKNINNSRKEIKKGYLNFIETCNKIKQTNGLRRVSSDHGPMALLYKRIFNLESSQHTPSQSSQSMKKLTKRVLIRRQFFQSQKIEPNIIHANLQSTFSARHNPKQQENSLSARIFQRKQFQTQEEQSQKNQIQQLQIKRIKEGFILSPDIQRKKIDNSNRINKGQKALPTSEQKEALVLEEVIATLTHELFCELMKIDDRRENVVDILQEGQDSNIIRIKGSEIKDFQIVEESSSLDFEHEINEEDFQVVEQSKLRQIYKIQGLSEKLQPQKNRKHRKSNTYNISPVSLEPIKFEEDEIINYGQQLFAFLKNLNIEEELIDKLNKNQGFSPVQYLRFLRDFQIPDQEYEPLISNQIFMEWEDYYDSKHAQSQKDEGYAKRQASAVFHRCIFECLIGFLQDFRPCGEKGEPFPWQKVMNFKRVLSKSNIDVLFSQSFAKLEHTIKLKCGIIEEKQVIFTQMDMQRVHEQNQDKIIFMLEEELSQSPHNWYQVEQHCLQIKLEVESELFDYIMLQALDELLQLL